MELMQLRYFVQVAKLESVSRAAVSLHISQPALSKTIGNLERELGAPLFDRIGKRIYLNEKGRFFLKGVEASLRELNNATLLVNELATGQTGTLRLGVFSPQHVILPCIEQFMHNNSQVQVDFDARKLAKTSQLLADFDGIFYTEGESFSHIQGIPFAEDETGLLVSSEHPLAHCGQTSLDAFKDDPFVFMTTSTGLYEQSYQLCIDSGFVPWIRATATSGLAQFQFVGSNQCVSFIAQSDFDARRLSCCDEGHPEQQFSYIRLRKSLPKQTLCIAFPRENRLTPVGRVFRDFALGYLGIPVTTHTLEVFEGNA